MHAYFLSSYCFCFFFFFVISSKKSKCNSYVSNNTSSAFINCWYIHELRLPYFECSLCDPPFGGFFFFFFVFFYFFERTPFISTGMFFFSSRGIHRHVPKFGMGQPFQLITCNFFFQSYLMRAE